MYWCKHYFLVFTGLFVLVLFSCKPGTNTANGAKYFDLRGYFQSEATRLSRSNPRIAKTSVHNGDSETKQIQITDWEAELKLFAESDINKPNWRLSYSADTSGDFLIYKAKDPKLLTRDIIVKKEGNKVKWVLIHNYSISTVFGKKLNENIEKLSYFPDSIYLIQKKQFTRVLGTNIYSIKGAFN